jgi:hypothetical protein
MRFRDKLEATLRAVAPLFEVPGVMVGGSEAPNLMLPDGATPLVVSQDVDLVIPVAVHADVCRRLPLLVGLTPSPDEPSVWLPTRDDLIEVNFIGQEPGSVDPADTYVLESPELPLMVFGPLGLLQPGPPVVFGGVRVPIARVAGQVVEKLLSDRGGLKGSRDLLVVAGLLGLASPNDIAEIERLFAGLDSELRHTVRSNLVVLSLQEPLADMPDPLAARPAVHNLLARFGAIEESP